MMTKRTRCLIICCLTPADIYFSYIHDENRFTDKLLVGKTVLLEWTWKIVHHGYVIVKLLFYVPLTTASNKLPLTSLTGRNYERTTLRTEYNLCSLFVPLKHELKKCFYK